MATLAEMRTKLTAVQAAIEAIESGGQSYMVDGQQVTRADLDTLYKREDRLESKIAERSRGGMIRGADLR